MKRMDRGRRYGLTAAALAALIAAACSVTDEDVEIDEFFRAPPPAAAEPDDRDQPAAPDPTPPDSVLPDEPPPAFAGPDDDDDGLELAEDIIRRYRNATYGYSLELVCPPFCDINVGGIDRVGFSSGSDPAVLNVATRRAQEGASLTQLEGVWLETVLAGTIPTVIERREVPLASDGETPSLLIDWEIDRRATGGAREHWRSLITAVGPIAYFINAGSLADSFAGLENIFQQAIDSFLALPDPPSLPGVYTRFGFAVPYDIDDFVGELGLPGLGNQPTANGGSFFLQVRNGPLAFILTWESVGQAIYDADAAIDDRARPPGAIAIEEIARDDFNLSDDISGRFAAFTATGADGNVIPLRVFAWYCVQSGRAFTLQSLSDVERPEVLDGFRCTASTDGVGEPLPGDGAPPPPERQEPPVGNGQPAQDREEEAP